MWCGEMLNCLKDVVPDCFDTVTAVVRNRLAISTIRRVDVEVVLGQWGSRWIDCWRDSRDKKHFLMECPAYQDIQSYRALLQTPFSTP
jgi:hypothetical protein